MQAPRPVLTTSLNLPHQKSTRADQYDFIGTFSLSRREMRDPKDVIKELWSIYNDQELEDIEKVKEIGRIAGRNFRYLRSLDNGTKIRDEDKVKASETVLKAARFAAKEILMYADSEEGYLSPDILDILGMEQQS